nr:hypothetical protein Iba_chr04eCG18820 [Ipomoea batatas]
MATPEAEGDEPLPIPDLSVLEKQVISGQSFDAPTAKAGQRRKRKSKVPEGGDSNEASYVVRSNVNEEVVTSAMQITTTMPDVLVNEEVVTSAMQITTTMHDVPNDEAAQMNSLPIQEEFPRSNVETVANHIQIEVIDHELLEENREQFLDEDPVLTIELFRVKQWRLWRIAEYKSHMSRVGPEMEKEELFALSCRIDEPAHEDMLEETVMIPGHSHAMVQIVESIEGLGRIPTLIQRPIMETKEILGGCETNRIPAEVEVEELATNLSTVPVAVQEQAEATILATVPTEDMVQVQEQGTVLAKVDNPLEVNVEIIENQDSLIEANI